MEPGHGADYKLSSILQLFRPCRRSFLLQSPAKLPDDIWQRDRGDQKGTEDEKDDLCVYVALAQADAQAEDDKCGDNAARQIAFSARR